MDKPPRNRKYNDPEEEIRNAMARGDFDDLRGKGKPLHLRRNPFLSPEEETAYNLLQDAGYIPDWMEEQRAIQAEVEAVRRALAAAWLARLAATDPARRAWAWQRAEARFRADAVNINRRIRDYNLKAPLLSLHMLSLRADEELQRLQMEHPEPEAPKEDAPAAEPPTEAASLSDGVRQIVTTRERTPRNPAWDTAWKRTLWRFTRRLRSLREKE